MRDRIAVALLALTLLLGVPGGVMAAAPDLTAAGAIATLKADVNAYKPSYNLGPTGMRGWIYRDGNNVGDYGTMSGQQPWQILVTTVGSGTPASGIMAVDDVILGANVGIGAVPLFTNDSRKSLGWAIGAAEAGDGKLNLKRWRAGTTSDVQIQLRVMGAYSPTAPFDCPKSALILSNACNVIANRYIIGSQSFGGTPGGPVVGLALLASGNTNYLSKVRTYARSIAPTSTLNPYSCDTWGWGYRNVFLSEYYLATSDPNVLAGITRYTIALAKAQSLYGTYGHGGCEQHADGSFNGSISWYGPVNSAGLVANMGIVLGRKCFVASGTTLDGAIDPAIERASKFFGYYVGKGSIPYGEHEPWAGGHGSNGKDQMAALMFALQGNRPVETEYYTRMSVAGYNGREFGHTGQGFSYLWGALAANIGGTNAVASHLAQVRWHLDLSRRYDGSFVYDGGEQYGGAENITDYWSNSSTYGGIDPTASYVLTYSLPKQQLYVTGKNANTNAWLSSDTVTNAIWVGMFNQVCSTYDTNQLVSAMGEYDPGVRSWAADTIGARANVSVPMLMSMANSTNVLWREAACQALGVKKDTSALTLLGQRLRDTNIWVRSKASKALQNFGSAASPQLTTMLSAFITNATDPHVIVWEDPIQIANGYLADELFNTLGSSTINAATNLLYPAVRAGLRQPDGMARGYMGYFIKNRLTWAHVQAVAPALVECIAERSPADRMFSDTIRYDGLATLGKYLVEEGIPLCLMVKEQTWHGDDWLPFDLLTTTYRGAAKEALSTLYKWQEHMPQFQADGSIGGCCPGRFPSITNKIAAAISAISSDSSPPTLNNFKKIVLASATPSTITLPTTNTSLSSVAAPDLDGGVPAFRWSKVSGAGNVSFSPNGTAASSNTVATFNSFGTYVLQASVVDTSILNSNIWITYNLGYYDFKTYTNFIGAAYSNVTVIVSVATNRAPVPQNQSLTTPVDTALPITLVAVDPNGDALTYSVVTSPAHGTLTGSAPNLVYTPATSYTGFDSFTFKANDGQLDSSIATVTLDVGTTGNRRPVAVNQSVTTAQNTAKAITLTGSDPDADPLTYMLLSSAGHGTLSGTPPNVNYVPAANFPGGNLNGADIFTFTVRDASLTSAVATVRITVTPPGPVVSNAVGATNLAPGVAQLRGTLTNAPADVRLYWGATDGGTNPANWTGTILLTNTTQPTFSSNVSNLLYGLTYYYRCSASNLYATGWAPATASFTMQRPVTPGPELISVNIGSSLQVGLVGPAGGSGLAWNQQPGLKTGSALLNSSGAPTTVGFSANASNVGEWGSPPLAMLAGGAFNWTANSSYTLTLSGLASSRKYDLSIASFHPNEDGSKALVSTANVTDTASPQTADNGGPDGNASTWVQGVNYVRFQNVQPGSGGSITMTIAGQDTTGNRRRAYLSGFQLVDTSTVPPSLSLTNSAATAVAAASAALHATLRCTGTVYQVSAFWNTVNGGTNATLWTNSAYVGSWSNLTSTNLTLTATNLAANTPYFFTFRATNAAEVLWATKVLTFTTPPPAGTLMAVDNAAGATNLAVGLAQLRGNLLCTNPATVRIYWGATDGGTNGPWANTNVLANLPNGMFASTVSNLFYGLTYYYRCHASNQTERAWAPATASFTTLPPSQSSPVPRDGLVLWLGGDLGAQTNGSGGVTNWVDNSGLGNNAVAGTAPTYTSAGLNGKPTLTFNGTSHYLRITNSSMFNFASNVTIFTVGRAGSSGSWAPVFISKNGENGLGWQLRRQGGNNYATFTTRGPSGGDDPAGSIPINNLWQLFTARYDGTSRNLWIDGTNDINLASSGAINANNNLVVIGARDTGSIGGFASCAIAEILVYTNALSASQQAAIGGYLATKYGLSTAYPAFTPPLLVALSNSPASSVASFSAALNSTLACTGSVYNVYACWNTVNGGTNAATWTNSACVGAWTNVVSTNLAFTVTNLAPSKLYYFTFRATNAVDTLWATNVQSFTTLALPPPPPVLSSSVITVTSGVPTFTFEMVAGYRYRLVYKTALADTWWVPVIAPPDFPLPDGWSATSTGSQMSLSDTSTAGQPHRFYRLEAGNP